MSIAPCKDCESRHVGCHSKCSKYSEWRELLNQENEKISKTRIHEADLIRRRNAAIAKRQKNKHY